MLDDLCPLSARKIDERFCFRRLILHIVFFI
jgi:hypothetical protein